MGPPHSPIFGTYGGHFCGRSETSFNGIGGPKLGPPKIQIETQNWCQFLGLFWYYLLTAWCYFKNTLIQRARFQHRRPTWQEGFSNLNQALFPGLWNHAKSKPHPKLRLVFFKKLAADTQWKIPGMCVRGCRIASMCFDYRDERRRPDGSVGMALVLPALTDCRWWFESLLVHSGVSSATRRKATGADHKKLIIRTSIVWR